MSRRIILVIHLLRRRNKLLNIALRVTLAFQETEDTFLFFLVIYVKKNLNLCFFFHMLFHQVKKSSNQD